MLDKSSYDVICSILSESFLGCMVGFNSSLFRTQRSYAFVSETTQFQVDLDNHLFVYLLGAQVGKDSIQPTWQRKVRDTELIFEYREVYFQGKDKGKQKIVKI